MVSKKTYQDIQRKKEIVCMIGLCIKYWNHNYGSMLQCYAVTTYLEKNNIDYEIIRYFKKKNLIWFFTMSFKVFFNKIFRNDVIEILKKKSYYIKNKKYKEYDMKRSILFDDFSKQHFSNRVVYVKGYKNLQETSKKFSIVVSGSDQLLSPGGLSSHFFTLEFCNEKTKRVTWASSFGVSYIPRSQIKATKKYLSRLNEISVREHSGACIVKELIDRDVPVICDPVMMLSKNEWDSLIVNKKLVEYKYIFAYFLGKNKFYREQIQSFADEKGLKIVTLRHLDQFIKEDENFGDFAPYEVSPEDFLNYIRNAEYVFTDSFHGSVFSIINHKKFLSFNRYSENSKVSKNSRIDTLMKNLNIHRKFNGDISLAPQNYYELSLKMLNKISREDIIRIAEKYFGNCGDYLFAVSNSSVKLPSKEEFLSVWKQTLNNEITAYEEEKLPQELMTAPAVKGKIISKRKLKNVDAKEYIFENGARVIMKKTDFEKDKINMSVLSMGGYSLYPEEDIPSALVGENYLWYSGINGFDSSQVQKIISNKVFDANWGLHRWGEYFYGSGNHQDFELALQLMYQFFENPQFTDQGWNYVYQLYDLQANNFGSSIQDALSSQYKKFFKDDSYYASIIIDKDFMAKVDRSKAEKITKERFSNAADFTFIFTGDFNEKKLLELCKRYIGSLKGDKDKKEECNFIYFSEPSSIKTSVIKKGSEPQANVRLLFRKNIEPASDVTSSFIDNELAAQLAELLETRLREIIREDMSGTYGVGVSAFSDGYPQRQFTFEINFGCAPERVMELKDAVITAIKDMQKEVVAESYTNNLREIYKRNTEKSLRDNGWWSERIKGIYFDKSEPETAIDDIENVIPDMITPEKMKELLNLYFNTDAYLFGYLIPEK